MKKKTLFYLVLFLLPFFIWLYSPLLFANDRQEIMRMAEQMMKEKGGYEAGKHCVLRPTENGVEKECQDLNDVPTPVAMVFDCNYENKALICKAPNYQPDNLVDLETGESYPAVHPSNDLCVLSEDDDALANKSTPCDVSPEMFKYDPSLDIAKEESPSIDIGEGIVIVPSEDDLEL